MGNKDSHIQIPSSILFPFSTLCHPLNDRGQHENHNMVYVLNASCEIYYNDIKKCNVIYGYYGDETENALNILESKFGMLKDRILSALRLNQPLSFSEKDVSTVIDFYKCVFSRSPKRHQAFIEEIAEDFGIITDLPDALALYKPKADYIDSKNGLCVFVNDTDVDFVIPQCCWSVWGLGEGQAILMPITPKYALGLYHHTEEDNFTTCPIEDTATIDFLNRLAISGEFELNEKIVYAKKKETLARYIPYIKEYLK